MKQQKTMNEKDVVDALKFDKELPQLKDQFQLLIEEINSLEYKRNSLRTALSDLQNQVSAVISVSSSTTKIVLLLFAGILISIILLLFSVIIYNRQYEC